MSVAFITSAMAQFDTAPAFPGAEGHGRFVQGGRGGEIRHVTNLNDSGDGSFRAAVNGSTKKIIVFDVAGVIPLESNINIGANTTILGQTAPEPGITLRYYTVNPGANNIIRYIRVRRGEEKDVNDGADASTQRNVTGIIIDHCSFSWSIDEVASFYDNNNFTMQWSTIAESLVNAGHEKGAHGYGGIWGGKLASFHHNLIAHVSNRGPRFNGARYASSIYLSNDEYQTYQWENPVQAENVDFRNCVQYNANGSCYGGPGGGQINIVNNYYKGGPSGNGNQDRITTVSVGASGNSTEGDYVDMTSRYYISGNTTHTTSGTITQYRDWNGVQYDDGVYSQDGLVYSKDQNNLYASDVPSITIDDVRWVQIKMDEPAPTGYVTTHTAEDAFNVVLEYAGASHYKDEVDERYATEAKNGSATYTGSVTKKKGLVDVVADVNGYTEETFGTGAHPDGYDTDNDGIPDEWETQWGLNPNNAADAKQYTIDEMQYYTNLEVYANSIVEEEMKAANADGEANFTEYYPTLRIADTSGSEEAEVISYVLAASTNTGSNTTASYSFSTNGNTLSITNQNSKSYTTGKEDGIKYSAGVQYTIVLPEDFVTTELVFTGYDNYADVDAYVSEVNGESFEETQYVFPQKDSSGNYVLTTQTVPVSATGEVTFTPAGKQCVWTITVNGTYATGVESVKATEATSTGKTYNLSGQRVSPTSKGIKIRDGKKFF